MKTPDRWQEIDALFARSLDWPPEKRQAFLNDVCDEEALRRSVEALLEASADTGDFLETPLAKHSGAFWGDFAAEVAPPASSLVGRTVGPYRLVRIIGRGGMGAVYLAERTDGQFDRRVAVKVLRRGFDADGPADVVQHFLFERQILASLSHPSIAHLYGGGVTEDDRPYFAEEAERHLLASYAMYKALGAQKRDPREALRHLAALYEAWGKPREAKRYAGLLRSE